MIELVAAWSVVQVVGQVRMITRSNISRQDRRFHSIILVAFVAVALPLLAVSAWANTLEFGTLALGVLFPLASVGCAVGLALPEAVTRHGKEREAERAVKAKAAKERRKQAETKAERGRTLAELGKSAGVFELIDAEPMLTQAEVAQRLGISRQTVSYHVKKLERLGLLGGNGREGA